MTLSTSAVAVCCCSGSLAQLIEQPRVLDGDGRLVRESRTSSICFSVNGRTSGPCQCQNADRDALAQHRDTKKVRMRQSLAH